MKPAEAAQRRSKIAFVGFAEPTLAEQRATWNSLLDQSGEAPPQIVAYAFNSEGLTQFQTDMPSIDVAIFLPHLPTWSRLPYLNSRGPKPLRTREFPWGLPQLPTDIADRVNTENGIYQQTLDVIDLYLSQAAKPFSRGLALFHPEDLGAHANGRPASPWQLARLATIAKGANLQRAALQQCRLGPCSRVSPMGILHNLEPWPGTVRRGWPRLNSITDVYKGPLQRQCGCGRRHQGHERSEEGLQSTPPTLEPFTHKWLGEMIYTYLTDKGLIEQHGLPQDRGRRVAELLPHMLPYAIDEDGYETEATILLDPLEEANADEDIHLEYPTETNTAAGFTKLDMEEGQTEQTDNDAPASNQVKRTKKQEKFENCEQETIDRQAEAAIGKDQGMI